MSMFVSLAAGETKTLRLFEDHEFEYTSEITGKTRYARKVIDKEVNTVAVWTYAFPLKRQIDAAIQKERMDPSDCELRVRATGSGPARRYEVSATVKPLSANDGRLIEKSKIDLRKVCK